MPLITAANYRFHTYTFRQFSESESPKENRRLNTVPSGAVTFHAVRVVPWCGPPRTIAAYSRFTLRRGDLIKMRRDSRRIRPCPPGPLEGSDRPSDDRYN